MKVAAWQAPLAACADPDVVSLIREQVDRCEDLGVDILCCPEAVVGGLADYALQPHQIAIETLQLSHVLAPLASDRVSVVIGFTELGSGGHLYNSAAVLARGALLGVYRKVHPAINRSVYSPGTEAPVFTIGRFAFGVLLCRDSTFPEPGRSMTSRGAQLFLVSTNNGMPRLKGGLELVEEARACDVARALESSAPVVRADVAGVYDNLVSYGASGIVSRCGHVLEVARRLDADFVVSEVDLCLPGASCAQDA